ncbi:MAG: pilus assembly protein PilM [Candidatus Wallbacteria bacterium]|nr:pilus assembly protein PilM [Candidatus Wallbacteria bacterium]
MLKSLIFPNNEKIAIDIGTRSIKYIEIKKPKNTTDPIEVLNFKSIPTPNDSLLATYTENPVVNPGAIQDALEYLSNSCSLKNRDTNLVLYDSTVIINWLSLNPGPTDVIQNLVLEKLSTFLPVPVSEWFVDFAVLEEKKDSKVIISEAMLKNNLFEFGKLMQRTGFNPVSIDISSFNVVNSFHKYLMEAENAKKNIAVVNMGHNNTTVMIFKEGVLKNLRSLGVGGRDFTQNIMESKGLTFEDAEKYKHEELFFLSDASEDQNKNENYNIIKPSFGKLIKGMYDSFDHYLAKFREFKIHEIILSGGAANFTNIRFLIHRHLNIPAKNGSELLNFKFQGNEMLENDKNLFSSAVGGLLRES